MLPASVFMGLDSSCVLLQDGGLKCFGWGSWGQLGNGSEENLGDAPGEMGNALPRLSL